jgi:hypothetical protein
LQYVVFPAPGGPVTNCPNAVECLGGAGIVADVLLNDGSAKLGGDGKSSIKLTAVESLPP